MLDFEKCKEVVEEAWKGLVTPTYVDAPQIVKVQIGKEFCKDMGTENFREFICSWEGFGRTVEAMEKRGYFDYEFQRDGCLYEAVFAKCISDDFVAEGTGQQDRQLGDTGNLIDATHLAALEAVRDANKKNA